ncbi:protein htrl, partial [Biomphalaria glabrata]
MSLMLIDLQMWPISSFKKKALAALLVISLAASALLLLALQSYMSWQKNAEDSIYAMSWEGFGPERGLYNFTVVTAMLDIGRGNWSEQSRPYNTYLLYMQRMLRLDVNMVVFVEPKGKPFIEWMRRGREKRTHIAVTTLKDLPYY